MLPSLPPEPSRLAGSSIAADLGLARRLWRYGRNLYRNAIAQEREYVARSYQLRAAVEAVLAARSGRNAAVELPTGTGKTLVACLAAAFWKGLNPDSRVLLIVPSRTLVAQHFDVARWVASDLKVDRLEDQASGHPSDIRRILLRSDLLISTPGLLGNALARRVVEPEVIASFDFVIVDEYDQLLVVEEDGFTTEVRHAEAWDRLQAQLPADARYLIKSATLGLGEDVKPGRRTKAQRRAEAIATELLPVRIHVPEARYRPVAPFKPISAQVLRDPRIAALLEGVAVKKGVAHLQLDEATGPLDYRDVERRAPTICDGAAGRAVRMRTPGGPPRDIVVTTPVQRSFCAIAQLMMTPQYIVEDLTDGLGVEFGNYPIKTASNAVHILEDVPRLTDDRETREFRFAVGAKADHLDALVAKRRGRGERGVLFVRTLTLLEAVRSRLVAARLEVFVLHGAMPDDQRVRAIDGFRRSAGGLLLMTRTTGGRGLDLPFADYAIFYSPKTDPVTMWQEASRIRSTLSRPKEILVMCYGAYEVGRLQAVLAAWRSDGRHISFSLNDVPDAGL